MKIGLMMDACTDKAQTPAEAADLLVRNGFETFFTGSDNPRLEECMTAARAVGLTAESLHAPFDGINDIWFAGEDGERMLERLMESLRACAKYEVPVDVVHLSSKDDAPHLNDIGTERFDRLIQYSKTLGVKIAFENQRKLANISYMFERYPKDIGFCWDVGHEACFTGGREYMPLFGKWLAELHIHDNFGVHERDEHMIPFDAGIDFARVARQIAAAKDYKGSLMFEIIKCQSGRYNGVTNSDFVARCGAAARRLNDMVEAAKKGL